MKVSTAAPARATPGPADQSGLVLDEALSFANAALTEALTAAGRPSAVRARPSRSRPSPFPPIRGAVIEAVRKPRTDRRDHDFHSAGRISGVKRIPIAQLKVGQMFSAEGRRLEVNESLTRYQRELAALAAVL